MSATVSEGFPSASFDKNHRFTEKRNAKIASSLIPSELLLAKILVHEIISKFFADGVLGDTRGNEKQAGTFAGSARQRAGHVNAETEVSNVNPTLNPDSFDYTINPFYRATKELLARNIPVVPIPPKEKGCRLKDWPTKATTDSVQIQAWQSQSPRSVSEYSTGNH